MNNQLFFEEVKYCINMNIKRHFIVQGEGGSGKPFTAQLIAAYTRSKNKIVVGCASTAFAANNYKDFFTAHSLFEIPVIEDEENYNESEIEHICNLSKNLQRIELLNNTCVIIWDEIIHFSCFQSNE
jgi:hypothetical protein